MRVWLDESNHLAVESRRQDAAAGIQ